MVELLYDLFLGCRNIFLLEPSLASTLFHKGATLVRLTKRKGFQPRREQRHEECDTLERKLSFSFTPKKNLDALPVTGRPGDTEKTQDEIQVRRNCEEVT